MSRRNYHLSYLLHGADGHFHCLRLDVHMSIVLVMECVVVATFDWGYLQTLLSSHNIVVFTLALLKLTLHPFISMVLQHGLILLLLQVSLHRIKLAAHLTLLHVTPYLLLTVGVERHIVYVNCFIPILLLQHHILTWGIFMQPFFEIL